MGLAQATRQAVCSLGEQGTLSPISLTKVSDPPDRRIT